MDTSKGYKRAAHKAATMAVVEEDFYEEMLDSQEDTAALFRVSGEEREAAATAEAEAAMATEPRRNGSPAPEAAAQRVQDDRAAHAKPETRKKPGFLRRLFGAMRGLG